MKTREKEFCRLMAIYGDPYKAARQAGFRKPDEKWQELLCREDIAAHIRKFARALRAVYEDMVACSLYRLSFGRSNDALRLLYSENPTAEELEALDLTSVSEIKRTKDKSVEIKFFDRIKACNQLQVVFNSSEESNPSGGLIEAMRLSAETLGRIARTEGDADED